MTRFVSFASAILVSGLALSARAQTGDSLLNASTSAVTRPAFRTGVELVALTVTVTDTTNLSLIHI